MHGINKAEAFLDTAFYNRLFYLWGYIKKFLAAFGIEHKIFSVGFHYGLQLS
jgi:hypothetical protein